MIIRVKQYMEWWLLHYGCFFQTSPLAQFHTLESGRLENRFVFCAAGWTPILFAHSSQQHRHTQQLLNSEGQIHENIHPKSESERCFGLFMPLNYSVCFQTSWNYLWFAMSGELKLHIRVSSLAFLHLPFSDPLTAGVAYIRVFIFYQHIKYHFLNMLKIIYDINQQYLKTVHLHFVKSE